MNSGPTVRHDAAASRYEIKLAGGAALAEYILDGPRLVLTRTFVPPALRGRGLAELLVRAALHDARAHGRRVVPQCSYVAAFIARHPEFQDLLAV
jgi:predicted GNAT family acetyltransferase